MSDEIVWQKSLKNALDLSRKENKLVLAAFFGSTCEACIRMDTCTLITPRVQDYMKIHFISIKYESGTDSDQFMRFGVTAKPAVIVLDCEGNEVFRKIGYFEPDAFIEKLEMARKKAAHRAARVILKIKSSIH
jgi:thioredoxin-related protein